MTKKLEMEKDAIGFFLSAHPLDEYARTLKRLGIRTFADNKKNLARNPSTAMTLVGIVGEIRKRVSKTGRPFAFISASDSGGMFEMLTFSEILEANLEKLESKKPLVFYVSVDQSGGEDNIRLSLQSVSYLDEIAGSSTEGISVTFTSKSSIEKIKEVISAAKKGRGKIILIPRTDSLDIPMELPGTYDTSPALLTKLRNISGVIEATEL
jgi:DNA polymerase-3 subunit alpha